MPDPLDDYRRKRNFAATPEPAPGLPLRRTDDLFVVHRHEARSLHYDLRLEHDGVLKSWAVPRGFSYDPADKRLAVRTEDHPLEYEHFHGRIPKGQYGAGTMQIWDRGRYRLLRTDRWADAMQQGELKLLLFGRHLRGEWHLVRTQQAKNSWLLFKSRDRYAGIARDRALGINLDAARDQPVPLDVQPMRWQAEAAPVSMRDPDWLFEMEFLGLRTLAHRTEAGSRLLGVDATPPSIAAGLTALRCEQALVDGVLVALDARGHPSPTLLQQALQQRAEPPLAYYAFDLLQWEDYDLRPLSLLERKAALRTLVPDGQPVLFVDHVAGAGEALLAAIAGAGLPAAIGKRASSRYVSGASADWRRIPVAATTTPAATHHGAAPPPEREPRWKPSNLGKVYWPAEGYTKGDLLAYYHAVAEALLPHLRDRPVHLNRFPDGIDGKSFYQREVKDGAPDWLRTVPIPHDGSTVPHHVIDDLDALLHVVNLGSIDLHPWLSRTASLDQPDWAVLDLDPKQAPFAHVIRIARSAGRLLRGIGLRPLLKTSGKSGMHIFVPLRSGYGYDHARMFLEAVSRVLLREVGDVATIERSPEKRDGKVYLDFLQNRRSQTIVPPYAVRPVGGASVSAPLLWDELEAADLSPRQFTIRTMPARLQRHGDLFRNALDDRQDLQPAILLLEELLRGR
ncbi:MAG: non-homologous end-joining DNA ligase [Planctomycetes bacterium]|jgi:bifunctional non-homologous end joining protein LigD|nr:non-homologous end-joining DNA ligase [Planctomycetota bacterium]